MKHQANARLILLTLLVSLLPWTALSSAFIKGESLSDALSSKSHPDLKNSRPSASETRHVQRIKKFERSHPLRAKKRKRRRKRKRKRQSPAQAHESKLSRMLRLEKLADPEFNELFTGKHGIDREYMKLIDDRKNLKKQLGKKQDQLYAYYREFEDKKKGMRAKRDAKLRQILQQASVDNYFEVGKASEAKAGARSSEGLEVSDGGLRVTDPEKESQKRHLMGMRDISDLKNLNIDRELARRQRKVKRENEEILGMDSLVKRKRAKHSFNAPRRSLEDQMPDSLKIPKRHGIAATPGHSPSFLVRNRHQQKRKKPDHFFKAERGLFEDTNRKLGDFFESREGEDKGEYRDRLRPRKRKRRLVKRVRKNFGVARRKRHVRGRKLKLRLKKTMKSKSKSKSKNKKKKEISDSEMESQTGNGIEEVKKTPRRLVIDAIPEKQIEAKSSQPETDRKSHDDISNEPSERELQDLQDSPSKQSAKLDSQPAQRSKHLSKHKSPKKSRKLTNHKGHISKKNSHKSEDHQASLDDGTPPPRELKRFKVYKHRYKERKKKWRVQWEEKNGIRLPRGNTHHSKGKKVHLMKMKSKFKTEFKFDWVRMKWVTKPKYKFRLVESIKDLDFWRSLGFHLKKHKLELEDKFDTNRPKKGNQMQCMLMAKFGKMMR